MENLNSYQFTTLSDISNLSFLFNLVCTPCTLNFAYGLKPKSVSSAVFKENRPHAEVLEKIVSHVEGCIPQEVMEKKEITGNYVIPKKKASCKGSILL